MLMKSLISLSVLGAANAFGNVDYSPASTDEAWDNHFSAFGGQDVQKIGLDYDDNSIVQVYSACESVTYEYAGRESIEGFFEELFADLYDTSTLAVHYLDQTATDGVFLVWSNAGTGFTEATDTFVFDSETYKILQQNIVVASETCEYAKRRRGRNLLQDVHASWDNHFVAFGAQDIAGIMEDYVEDSVVVVYNFHDATATAATQFEGLAAIEGFFIGLFTDLEDLTNLQAPVVDTTADPTENTFLVWGCPGCNSAKPEAYGLVTDSFVYGGENAQNGPAIIRQNIVIFTASHLE